MCTARSFLTSRLPLEVSRFIFTFRLPLLPLRFPSLPRNNPTLRKLKPCPLPPHRTSSVSDIICQRRGSSRFCPHPPVTLFNIFFPPCSLLALQIPSSPSRRQSVSSSSYSHSIDIDCSTVPSVSCWLLPAISSPSLTSLYSSLFFSTLSFHPADNDSDVLIAVGLFVSFFYRPDTFLFADRCFSLTTFYPF